MKANKKITVTELRNTIDIEKIKQYIGKFKFGRNGACDTIAEMIGRDLASLGGIESCYFDVVDDEDKDDLRFMYERRVTSDGKIPHRIIELFEPNDDMKFIGTIDLPYKLYEIPVFKNKVLHWLLNDKYINIKKSDIVIKLCAPRAYSPTI